MAFKMQVSGKQMNPKSLNKLSDWGERAQPTPLQFEGRRV
jgi:hypothetical protein